MKRLPLIVFLVLCVLCVAQALYYYPQLPERVASHFGASGQPDGWSTKQSFLGIYLFTVGLVAVLFLGVQFGMSRIPTTLINLPNKDYWLSPERRQGTFDFMAGYFPWFASATTLLLLDVFHQSFQVNLGRAEALAHPVLSISVYVAFTAVWTIGLIVKFARKGA